MIYPFRCSVLPSTTTTTTTTTNNNENKADFKRSFFNITLQPFFKIKQKNGRKKENNFFNIEILNLYSRPKICSDKLDKTQQKIWWSFYNKWKKGGGGGGDGGGDGDVGDDSVYYYTGNRSSLPKYIKFFIPQISKKNNNSHHRFRVSVEHRAYFRQLYAFLNQQGHKGILAFLVFYQYIETYLQLINTQLYDKISNNSPLKNYYDNDSDQTSSVTIPNRKIVLMYKYTPLLLNELSRKMFQIGRRDQRCQHVITYFGKLKSMLLKYIQKSTWRSNKERREAIHTVKNVKIHVGYPHEHHDTFRYYDTEFEYNKSKSFMWNLLHYKISQFYYCNKERIQNNIWFKTDIFKPFALYDHYLNAICVSYSLLRPPFYYFQCFDTTTAYDDNKHHVTFSDDDEVLLLKDFCFTSNFAGIVRIIAHELIHTAFSSSSNSELPNDHVYVIQNIFGHVGDPEENLADLLGTYLALQLYTTELKTTGHKPDYFRFFWAATVARRTKYELLFPNKQTSPSPSPSSSSYCHNNKVHHSPEHIRINAPLSVLGYEFYDRRLCPYLNKHYQKILKVANLF